MARHDRQFHHSEWDEEPAGSRLMVGVVPVLLSSAAWSSGSSMQGDSLGPPAGARPIVCFGPSHVPFRGIVASHQN